MSARPTDPDRHAVARRTRPARRPAQLEPTECTPVADAIDPLRRCRAPLAAVPDVTGRLTGMVSLDDLSARFLPPQAT
ncbi:hypothetical protein [Streptomyces sp. NPDC093591]|uniref:hypothetical protein n=1 Tax=Streptomyces sp. NPDC093591 TaxID=3366044 RepID=UPI0037FC874E